MSTPGSVVLLVDDSVLIRNAIKVHLRGLPLRFAEADDGARGLDMARLVRPDVAVVDVNMPGLGGVGFVLGLRADPQPRVSRLPVILLTANGSDDVRRFGLDAGANVFLRKPATREKLLPALAQFIPGLPVT